MNYSQSEKMIDDMQDEVDAIYNMAILMFDYISYKDIDMYENIQKKAREENKQTKKAILEQLARFIQAYKKCDRVNVRNETISRDRVYMDAIINEIYLKVITERFKLDDFS